MAELADLTIYLRNIFLTDGRKERFLQICWQFNIFVLKGEVHGQYFVKSVLFQELSVKFGVFKLLEENDKDFGKTRRILIWHQNVSFSFETPHVALHKEGKRKGELFK